MHVISMSFQGRTSPGLGPRPRRAWLGKYFIYMLVLKKVAILSDGNMCWLCLTVPL